MNKKDDKNNYNWALGVMLIAICIHFIINPSPEKVVLECDRAVNVCTFERTELFQKSSETINIADIHHAHFEELGFMIRGYHGIGIKLKGGRNLYLSAGLANSSESKERELAEKINNFLSNQEIKKLTIIDKGISVIYLALALLIGGLYFVYKAIKPYVIQGMNEEQKKRTTT